MRPVRIGVIGHVEWVTFALGVAPATGEIAMLASPFSLPAGGGAVTAVELSRMGASVVFFTALGNDQAADASRRFLELAGVELRAAARDTPQTRAVTILDPNGERTILVLGQNLQPALSDSLGWDDTAGLDAVYFTGDDPATLVAGRRAPILIVTARRLAVLAESGVRADCVVGSGRDPGELIVAPQLAVPPRLWVQTGGGSGGSWQTTEPPSRGQWSSVPAPSRIVDTYGAGDCFLAGFTFGLARGENLEAALRRGAEAGARCVARRGPYEQ